MSLPISGIEYACIATAVFTLLVTLRQRRKHAQHLQNLRVRCLYALLVSHELAEKRR